MTVRKSYSRLMASLSVLPFITAGALAQTYEVAEADVVSQSVADDFGADAEGLEENAIIVTGTRGLPRTVLESAVPVDSFNEETIEKVSHTDLNDTLRTLVPSFTLSRQPISDGSTFIRPASLRGLPTDKTLVLVNSKRRHRAALVTIGGSGTQGPDLATIPAEAIGRIEVLRDGASALYGSDAIAGVINILLKSDPGIELTAQAGEFYEGDGFEYRLGGYAGTEIGDGGIVAISGEYTQTDATNRGVQYCESWFCVDDYAARPGNEEFAAAIDGVSSFDVVQPWGQPETEAARVFANAILPVQPWAEFYAFGNYSWSTSTGNFFYRYPGNGTIEDLRLEDGSIYNPLELFPGGFTPKFSGDVTDASIVAGMRGEFPNGFAYDLSGRFGDNEIDYSITDTINPSLGPLTPTSFDPGALSNEEFQVQLDFSQEFRVGAASELVIAAGISYLDEAYIISQGGSASYAAGPFAQPDPFGFCTSDGTPTAAGAGVPGLDCADPDDPVYTVVGVGSNGFPGYSPAFSNSYKRDSLGIYGDLSLDVTESLFVQGALRYEKYSDFDDELVYKLAARLSLSDSFAIRGSYGTGFRAPTPGQQGTTNVSTRLPNGFPVATGLFPASSAVAQALGATALEAETSTNYTAGITAGIGDFSLTVDYYRIELDDRLNAISTISVVDDCDAGTPGVQGGCLGFRGNLIDAGVVGAESIGGVFYFTNAFDTVTQGVDVVATYAADWSPLHQTNFTAAFNYNETDFDGDVNDLFNEEDRFDFVNAEPEWRAILTLLHEWGPADILIRGNLYGPYENAEGGSAISVVQEFDPELLLDVELSYGFGESEQFRLSVGARNILDNYPAPGEIGETCCGRVYRSDSIVDWQGGFYYARAKVEF